MWKATTHKYIARPCTLSISEQDMDKYNTARTIHEWENYFMEIMISLCPFRTPEVIKLPKVMHIGSIYNKPTVERRLFTTENYSMVVEFYVERTIPWSWESYVERTQNKNQHSSRLNRVKKSRQ